MPGSLITAWHGKIELMDKEIFSGTVFTAPYERRGRFTSAILRRIGAESSVRILDIGCGTGNQLLDLAAAFPFSSLTGIDISTDNIALAEKNRRESSFADRLEFVAADYMKYNAGSFDIIISDSTLQNIDAPTAVLFSKISGNLNTGGVLLATMPYDCLFNKSLWAARRIFRALRSSMLDSVIFRAGKLLHRGAVSEDLIRERIHYMYLLPHCVLSSSFYEQVKECCGLQLLEESPVPHVSIAQPRHMMATFGRQEKV